jgi:hypothetical protein
MEEEWHFGSWNLYCSQNEPIVDDASYLNLNSK